MWFEMTELEKLKKMTGEKDERASADPLRGCGGFRFILYEPYPPRFRPG